MGILSNLRFLRGLRPPQDLVAIEIRPATPAELENAVRLILASPAALPDDRQVQNLVNLNLAYQPHLPTMLAFHSGHLISAVLPIVSPGRTMLLFPPNQLHGEFHLQVTRRLIEAACHNALLAGIHLAQVLLDNHASPLHSLLLSCSFKPLAELLYLQADIPPNLRPQPLAPDFYWLTYSQKTHHLFSQTILASYQQSLDCPTLNGLRDIDDILAGHKATGNFNPDLWFLLCRNDSHLGVLLLSPIPRSDIIELIYLGVPPNHRHHGTADLLMRHAAYTVSALHHTRLSLAVDANNLPALRLYWRHGLQAIGKKTALLRDLRIPTVTLGPALQQPTSAAEPSSSSPLTPHPSASPPPIPNPPTTCAFPVEKFFFRALPSGKCCLYADVNGKSDNVGLVSTASRSYFLLQLMSSRMGRADNQDMVIRMGADKGIAARRLRS
ncbi:MAG: GNAT family N-acetyltransferase [Planctomycetota bacterium]|nr:GNAT family N-acetyltransferase [Planctomycetota bacterium]